MTLQALHHRPPCRLAAALAQTPAQTRLRRSAAAHVAAHRAPSTCLIVSRRRRRRAAARRGLRLAALLARCCSLWCWAPAQGTLHGAGARRARQHITARSALRVELLRWPRPRCTSHAIPTPLHRRARPHLSVKPISSCDALGCRGEACCAHARSEHLSLCRAVATAQLAAILRGTTTSMALLKLPRRALMDSGLDDRACMQRLPLRHTMQLRSGHSSSPTAKLSHTSYTSPCCTRAAAPTTRAPLATAPPLRRPHMYSASAPATPQSTTYPPLRASIPTPSWPRSSPRNAPRPRSRTSLLQTRRVTSSRRRCAQWSAQHRQISSWASA